MEDKRKDNQDSSESDDETEIDITYDYLQGNPINDIENFKKLTKTSKSDKGYTTEKRERIGKKKFKCERTDVYSSDKKVHLYKEKGTNATNPKNPLKAMKPTKQEMVGSASDIWASANDKLAEMGYTGFEATTVNKQVVAVAAEAHASIQSDNPFGPSASAGASAAKAGAHCGASASGLYARAGAKATFADASAKAALVDGIVEVSANAEAYSAQASANASVMGVHAGANAKLAEVSAGLNNTPLEVGASILGAGAETGIGWEYTGASAGAHLAEAHAGPFGIRAGVKFGAGIKNGIPQVDMGPVTTPCCVM